LSYPVSASVETSDIIYGISPQAYSVSHHKYDITNFELNYYKTDANT